LDVSSKGAARKREKGRISLSNNNKLILLKIYRRHSHRPCREGKGEKKRLNPIFTSLKGF